MFVDQYIMCRCQASQSFASLEALVGQAMVYHDSTQANADTQNQAPVCSSSTSDLHEIAATS
jgi:hypothetical protein